ISDVAGPALDKFAHLFVDVLTQKIWRLSEGIRALATLLRGDLKGAAEHYFNSQYGVMPEPAAASSKEQRATAVRGAAAPVAANSNAPAARSAQDQAMAYFMRQGWTREQAAGIVANLNRESG